MAKRTRAPARRGRAEQTAQCSRKTAMQAAGKTARKSAVAKTKQASLARTRKYTPELLAYARYRFEHTEDSFTGIAADLGISREGLRLMGRRRHWKRHVPPPRGLPAAVKQSIQREAADRRPEPQAGGEENAPILADTVARLHRAVLDELAAIEALRTHSPRAGSSARTARTLANLTETLQKLQRLQPDYANTGSEDADMPADIDEFRNELARRIDAFVNERTDARAAHGAVIPPMDGTV